MEGTTNPLLKAGVAAFRAAPARRAGTPLPRTLVKASLLNEFIVGALLVLYVTEEAASRGAGARVATGTNGAAIAENPPRGVEAEVDGTDSKFLLLDELVAVVVVLAVVVLAEAVWLVGTKAAAAAVVAKALVLTPVVVARGAVEVTALVFVAMIVVGPVVVETAAAVALLVLTDVELGKVEEVVAVVPAIFRLVTEAVVVPETAAEVPAVVPREAAVPEVDGIEVVVLFETAVEVAWVVVLDPIMALEVLIDSLTLCKLAAPLEVEAEAI